MKSSVLALLLAFTSFGLFAQNIDKAKELLKSKKVMDAKAEIDKVLQVEKNQKSAEAWYTRCKIYAAIADDSTISNQVPNAHQEAFEALKKYISLDGETVKEKEKQQLLLKLDGYKPINSIYSGYFQDGVNSFKLAKYEDALADFKGALAARDFMFTQGWTNVKFDTLITFYSGIAAEHAKKRDDAAFYYSQIADAKLSDNNYLNIYKWLSSYYSQDKGDEKNALKYVNLGREVFPKDSSWNDLELSVYDNELDEYRKKGNKDSLFAKYEAITKALPNNNVFVYNYGVELYNYAIDTSSGKRPDNADALIVKAKEKLTRSLQIDPNYAQASMLLGSITYNEALDLKATTKNIKGQKPEDIKKRADIRIAAGKKFDEAIPYLEQVEKQLGPKGKLKQEEKRTLKDAYDLLISIYEQKNQKDKSEAYTTKYNDVDKVH